MKLDKALKIAIRVLEKEIDVLEDLNFAEPYQEEETPLDKAVRESYGAFHKIQQFIGILEEK